MDNHLYPMVILAGGLATRLRPLTTSLPKALIHINQEPFINHQLRLLQQHGIAEIVLCVGYLGDMIEKHLGDGKHLGMALKYIYDGAPLLGTAGAIKKALPWLDDHFFVLNGDSYLDCDYAAVKHAYLNSNKAGLMTVFRNNGQWDTSNIEFVNGEIINYDKLCLTKQMHYIDFGLSILSKRAFDQVPDNTPYDLALLYQNLLKQNQLAAFEVNRRFYEVGSFAGIKELEYYLSQTMEYQ